MTGAELIAAERQRQMDVEGWTPEHDAEHHGGELVQAARAYAAVHATPRALIDSGWAAESVGWPWAAKHWKPSDDPIRNLVKAGALIAAEIDRLAQGQVSIRATP